MQIWDLIISGGTLELVKTVLQLLEANKNLLLGGLNGDNLLCALGEFEKSPFGVIDYIYKHEIDIESDKDAAYQFKVNLLEKMSKSNIKNYPVKKEEYDRLIVHYWNIHEPILKFWSEPQQSQYVSNGEDRWIDKEEIEEIDNGNRMDVNIN